MRDEMKAISALKEESKALKIKLYHSLLQYPTSVITSNEMHIMLFLAQDKDIQEILEKNKNMIQITT